ncbi:unnamed protein product [Phytomonas sp. EM1]|nr:unnamed protein product [Phytomonas sp. EM1]|eukprot:CCW60890.1 unnamed protein product [Phytomonas sp. isolate EM1]
MDDIKPISPFTFISWKEDENSIVVGTKDTSFGYVALMQIDGIDIDDIVNYAKSQREKNWQNEFAKNFPFYVLSVAGQRDMPCFVTTKHATIEYCDLQTNEVLETELEATEDAYNESVRIEAARAEYDKLQSQEKGTLPSVDTFAGIKRAARSADDSDAGEEDLYEDIDEDNENDANHSKRFMLDMISSQIHSAVSIGVGLGLTSKEIKGAYSAAVGPSQVPQNLDECMKVAEGNSVLMKFFEDLQQSDRGNCQHQ